MAKKALVPEIEDVVVEDQDETETDPNVETLTSLCALRDKYNDILEHYDSAVQSLTQELMGIENEEFLIEEVLDNNLPLLHALHQAKTDAQDKILETVSELEEDNGDVWD